MGIYSKEHLDSHTEIEPMFMAQQWIKQKPSQGHPLCVVFAPERTLAAHSPEPT
jgi:hypothetical protein